LNQAARTASSANVLVGKDELMNGAPVRFLRYPGGKQRVLDFLLKHLPARETIQGKFVEPFVGGGAIFFAINPRKAILTDVNPELIDLYRGIRLKPTKVWQLFRDYPSSKRGYYRVRGLAREDLDLPNRAARTLYLNRTCFKGMWRHNSSGQFNVGYGGQDRRWTVGEHCLKEIARRLKRTLLRCSDFEPVIDASGKDDFVFVDPPYRPGEKEMPHDHYAWSFFHYKDHERLAKTLRRATKRSVRWAMTTSSHPDVLKLFRGNQIIPLPRGTGSQPGLRTNMSVEVLICNCKEVS
jgi:DNA adenine methylase